MTLLPTTYADLVKLDDANRDRQFDQLLIEKLEAVAEMLECDAEPRPDLSCNDMFAFNRAADHLRSKAQVIRRITQSVGE